MKKLSFKDQHIAGSLKVFSGACCLCDVGMYTGYTSTYGDEVDLYTGDIVLVWYVEYPGTDLECWQPVDGISVVVADQYQSFSDGSIVVLPDNAPFVMGIKPVGFANPKWKIQLLKSHKDVVEGEHWKNYGFNYKRSELADKAMKEVKHDQD